MFFLNFLLCNSVATESYVVSWLFLVFFAAISYFYYSTFIFYINLHLCLQMFLNIFLYCNVYDLGLTNKYAKKTAVDNIMILYAAWSGQRQRERSSGRAWIRKIFTSELQHSLSICWTWIASRYAISRRVQHGSATMTTESTNQTLNLILTLILILNLLHNSTQ